MLNSLSMYHEDDIGTLFKYVHGRNLISARATDRCNLYDVYRTRTLGRANLQSLQPVTCTTEAALVLKRDIVSAIRDVIYSSSLS